MLFDHPPTLVGFLNRLMRLFDTWHRPFMNEGVEVTQRMMRRKLRRTICVSFLSSNVEGRRVSGGH